MRLNVNIGGTHQAIQHGMPGVLLFMTMKLKNSNSDNNFGDGGWLSMLKKGSHISLSALISAITIFVSLNYNNETFKALKPYEWQ